MSDIESLGWDDEIEAQDSEYVLLEPGTYTFTVARFDREQFDGSEKMGPCPCARLQLACSDGAGHEGTVTCRLYLNRRQQWKLTQFFKATGLIPADAEGTTRLPWGEVLGSMGQVALRRRTYNGKEYNEVDRFVVPERAASARYGAL